MTNPFDRAQLLKIIEDNGDRVLGEGVNFKYNSAHISDAIYYLIRPIQNMVCMSTPTYYYYPYMYKYRRRLEAIKAKQRRKKERKHDNT